MANYILGDAAFLYPTSQNSPLGRPQASNNYKEFNRLFQWIRLEPSLKKVFLRDRSGNVGYRRNERNWKKQVMRIHRNWVILLVKILECFLEFPLSPSHYFQYCIFSALSNLYHLKSQCRARQRATIKRSVHCILSCGRDGISVISCLAFCYFYSRYNQEILLVCINFLFFNIFCHSLRR